MDRQEAGAVAAGIVAELRSIPYDALVKRFLDEIETRELTGGSGTEYQAEIQGVWDSGQPGDLRIMVAVDDGSLRGAFSPVARDFIIASDGTFVGESEQA